MPHKQSAQRILLLLLIFSLALPGAFVRAQNGSQAFAAIISPDFSKFPTFSALLDAFDDQGQFLSGLTPANVVILENGQPVKPDSLQELNSPLTLAVAINSSPSLAVRDSFGISPYDKIATVLSNWAAAQAASPNTPGAGPNTPGAGSPDNINLTWNGGIVASNFPAAEWKRRFDGFDPALRSSKSSLAALTFALDAVIGAPAVPGQKKAILLISPHLDKNVVPGLKDLADRAQQAKVHIYVWMTDTKAYFGHSGALALQDLANATGGQYLTYSGVETLPNPEEWLSPLRHIYQLTYRSRIRKGGPQTLSVQVNAKGLALTTAQVNFELDVEPPNPALLSPPIQIVRQNPDKPFDIETFRPTEQAISILVEFPDGHLRKLTRTALYVDDKKVAENTTEPFDKFTWDVSGYVASGQHSLEVEAQDDLGLSRKSSPVPVQVTVVQPPGGLAGLLMRNSASLTVVLVLLAGVVVLVILFFGGRTGLLSLAERRKAYAQRNDPVTQPVPGQGEPTSAARPAPFPWLRRNIRPAAYLVKLTREGQPASGDPLALSAHEITLGTDPTQATHLLDDASISPLHARLRMNENGSFQLIDQNSVAGTWVNFESVSLKEGCTLRHGDVIHFGQLTYRFVLGKPPAAAKPTITPN